MEKSFIPKAKQKINPLVSLNEKMKEKKSLNSGKSNKISRIPTRITRKENKNDDEKKLKKGYK